MNFKAIRKIFMKKIVLCFRLFAASFTSALAGGLVTNTNLSAAFLSNPARRSSLELDAVYYNPAGVAFLQKGFPIGLINQSALLSRNVTATVQSVSFVPPSAMENSLYEG